MPDEDSGINFCNICVDVFLDDVTNVVLLALIFSNLRLMIIEE